MAEVFDRMKNLLEWLKTQEGLHFQQEVMGMTGAEYNHKALAAALSKVFSYWGDSFPLFKDSRDNELRCEPLQEFLQGQEVEHERLATAIVLLMQAFGGACDANWSLRESLARIRRQPPHLPRQPRPPYRPTRI